MRLQNKKASFDYEVKDKMEAGMQLLGPEVKSAKLGQVDFSNARIKIQAAKFKGQKEAFVVGMHIFPYKHADNSNYDPQRTRKLLLHQKEILALETRMRQARLMLVPTAIYTKSGLVKMEIGLVRGKKKYEKREGIKKRDLDRENVL